MIVPISDTAAAEATSSQTGSNPPDQTSPRHVARTYIESLAAGDRASVNEVIATAGELDRWSANEFTWVNKFEIEFVNFELIEKRRDSIIGDITLTIAKNTGTVRYQFRKTDSGWRIWDAIDGFRSTQNLTASAEAVAETYITALDAGNRGAVNELLAADGQLSKWSSREFGWVNAFNFQFQDFKPVRTTGNEVIGDIEFAIDGNEETVRYVFQEANTGRVKLYAAINGIRTTGETSAESTAEAYIAALDDGNRGRVNDLIGDQGALDPWSTQDFRWVQAFSLELTDFESIQQEDDVVVADLLVRLDDSTSPVRYEFRQVDTRWKVWKGIEPIR
jgi:hypothetical protein